MIWHAGSVTVVSDDQTIRRLGPALMTSGFATSYVTYAAAMTARIDGALVIDARGGASRGASLLKRLKPESQRAAVVLANPQEPFVYRTIGSVCPGVVVLYDPVDRGQLLDVLDRLVSRRKAS